MAKFRIGIDLGGTKIEAILLRSESEDRACSEQDNVLKKKRLATPSGHYEETIRAIQTLVFDLKYSCVESQEISIGIGIPGSISPETGLIRNANSTCLNGHNLQADLKHALRQDVKIENDANCFAVSEAIDGAGQDKDIVFAVILGTGVGAGIALSGKPLLGCNKIAGEWGHNPLPSLLLENDFQPQSLPICHCGRLGCIETFLSGPGVILDHHKAGGAEKTVEELVESARKDCAIAKLTLKRHVHRLAASLAGVVNILDPDVIVLGGGLSNMDHLYSDLYDAMRPFVFSDCFKTPIRKAQHGDSSGVRGAAWLWS